MNRRVFLTSSASTALLAALPLAGCDNTTVAEFVTLIGSDAATLATYFGQSSLAANIKSLAAQIAVDITNWQSGSTATNAINAINDLIALINSIPVQVPYAPLIVLILSALTGLLALLPNSVAAMAQSTRDAIRTRNVTPMHFNGVDKHSMTQGKKQFESMWNSLSANLPLTH